MTSAAEIFAKSFQAAFDAESGTSDFTEVDQFRAMMRAFGSLSPSFYVEEFHGFKRQIYFDTTHAWLRPRARCELCDVLIVAYSTTGGIAARMTLLQAKLSRDTHLTGTATHSGKVEPQVFKGNYEQWHLLSGRPSLIPTTVFSPPVDLLSSAILPSVGTFGVFHRKPTGTIDMFYATADSLTPASVPTGPNERLGKLATIAGQPNRRIIASRSEATYCASSRDFAKDLYQLQVGTPIYEAHAGAAPRRHEPQANWVRGVLASHLAESDINSRVARSLLSELGDSDPLPVGAEIPSVVVLQSDQPIDRLIDQ